MQTNTAVLFRPYLNIPLWQWLFLIATTLGLSAASRLLTVSEVEFSAIWPASGIFLGAVLALGKRSLWVLLPSMLIWSIALQKEPWLLALTGAVGLAIGSCVASYLISSGKHSAAKQGTLSPLHYLPNLYFKGAIIGSGISSLIGAAGYALAVPTATDFQLQNIWLVYWILEALGVILFAPLFFLVLHRPQLSLQGLKKDFSRHRFMIWGSIVILVIVASVVLGQIGNNRYAHVLALALFPLVYWFATEGSSPSLDFIIPSFAIIFVVFSIHQWAGRPPIDDITDLLRVLLQVGILVVMAQIVANINHQRHILLERFRRQAYQDYRTGLANDRGLYEAIENTLQQHHNGSHWLAYISLTDMHIIKELLAMDGAITIESVLTQQLQQFAHDNAVIARLSEGRYVVLLPNVTKAQACDTIQHIYHALSRPVDEAGMSTDLRIAIGVTPVNGQLHSAQQYISVAVQALKQAQQKTVSIQWVADPKASAANHYTLLHRFGLLKEAIEKNQLELFAQEIRGIKKNHEGISFEVLVRMRDENKELLSPAYFIPAAEAFGLMPALDRWVIKHSLGFLAANRKRLRHIQKCAINLSGASLSDPELANYIARQLTNFSIPAHKITFEITETEAIRSKQRATEFIIAIHQLGCRVSLDDFGTGLASFEYLRQFRFDELKIDGVFIRQLAENNVDESIVNAICQVAATMQLKTVAEFVEDAELCEKLARLGVDYAQGYGISKPKPLRELFLNVETAEVPARY
ncbi:hypothetical protein CWE09_09180 [Aliidiomarina minuta]|uniref:EAL domain-containing protein n=1 Tax=Aliidiomarina minuta TaxID=880057 RepID=A0A432W9P4_9GAMM|nr:EAL domain-containing protein [Aliidiomarina minuta]RUO26844.1 hypothetical protein CWE09_09180 [Aliidiomarina minuta]